MAGPFSFLSNLAGIGSLALGAYGMLRRERRPAGYDEMIAAQAQARQISDMISNPNNAQFQQLVGEEEQKSNADTARMVNSIIIANRRAQRRGGAFFANPERQDETMASLLLRSREASRGKAMEKVRANLQASLTGNTQAYTAASGVASTADLMQQRRRQNLFGGAELGVRALDYLGRDRTPSPSRAGDIAWWGPRRQPIRLPAPGDYPYAYE